MLFALGAVSSALDAIQSLTSSKSSSRRGRSRRRDRRKARRPIRSRSTAAATHEQRRDLVGQRRQTSADLAGDDERVVRRAKPVVGQHRQRDQLDLVELDVSSHTSTSREDALKHLFSQIDADGDGKITKSEFEDALGAGGTNLAQADDVFSKLDANSDDSVSLDEMSKALKSGHRRPPPRPGRGRRVRQQLGFLVAERRLDLDHDDRRRRLDHHHRHLCRRLQDVDDGAGRLQLFP